MRHRTFQYRLLFWQLDQHVTRSMLTALWAFLFIPFFADVARRQYKSYPAALYSVGLDTRLPMPESPAIVGPCLHATE